MKKYLKYMFIVMVITSFFSLIPKTLASEKQITCDYEYTGSDSYFYGFKDVKFRFVVYNDKAELLFTGGCQTVKTGNICYPDWKNELLYVKFGNKVVENYFSNAYDSNTKKYSCPKMMFQYSDYGSMIVYGEDANDSYTVKTTVHKQTASYEHKKICTYMNKDKAGLGQAEFNVYYEAPSTYSISGTYNGNSFSTNISSNGLTTSFNGYPLNVQAKVLNELFGDFDPKKTYNNCKKNNLYFNNNMDNFTLDTERTGSASALLLTEDEYNNIYNPGSSSGDGENSEPGYGIVDATCDTLLGSGTTELLKKALTIIQIVGVLLAIVLGMMDFVNALMSGDADSSKKASKNFIVRISMAAVLLLVPMLLKFILTTFGHTGDSFCILK